MQLYGITLWHYQTSSYYYNQVPKLIYEEHHSHLKVKMNDTSNILLYCSGRVKRKEKKFLNVSWENVWPWMFQNKLLNIFNKIHFSTPLNTYIRWKDMHHHKGSCKWIKLTFTSTLISIVNSTWLNHHSIHKCKTWLLKFPSSEVLFPYAVI